jgi:DNA-binding NtrC family response regulator
MPDMSGPQLAATVREHWPHIGVLFLSGHAASTLATGSIDPTRLLTKPIAADRLVQAVADALDQIG